MEKPDPPTFEGGKIPESWDLAPMQPPTQCMDELQLEVSPVSNPSPKISGTAIPLISSTQLLSCCWLPQAAAFAKKSVEIPGATQGERYLSGTRFLMGGSYLIRPAFSGGNRWSGV